ncbi:MAG: M15 family metallopeptidase [Actinobacteria bacterium]|nr:M15 family metallopeptidase [Actinomycetota bacterium]
MSFRTYSGYTHSENGWRICDRNECDIVRSELQYVDTAPIRKGAAFETLSAWLHWYDQNVPGEIVSSVWGWSAENDVANSNHLSGTAVDINASQYPWHGNVMETQHPDRYNKIREGLELFEGIIFWGADWSSSRDEMHFQLNEGTADGDHSSDWLNDFVARRISSGRLIVGSSVVTPVSAPVETAEYSDEVEAGFAQLRQGGWL